MQAALCTVHVQATCAAVPVQPCLCNCACAAVPVQPCLCIRAGAAVFVQLWLRNRAGAAVSLQPCHCKHLRLGSSAAFVVSVAVCFLFFIVPVFQFLLFIASGVQHGCR